MRFEKNSLHCSLSENGRSERAKWYCNMVNIENLGIDGRDIIPLLLCCSVEINRK
jgi:hypothetical protein